MDEKQRVVERLHELKRAHKAALGEGPGEAPGFIQDEQATRKSYKLVAQDALDAGVISRETLAAENLPEQLDTN